MKRTSTIHLEWAGEHRFDSGRPGGPAMRMDASGATGQSPVDTLVSALAACTAVDVVDILAKRRTPLGALQIDAIATRREEIPRRIVTVEMTYHLTGEGVQRAHAERAIDLAISKYCSVRDSLDAAIPVHYRAVLNGETGELLLAGAPSEAVG
ncbi:MAG TPA: OsmC family protein [Gemmatimonadaceae bacterium]|nr:OsmC family protein [Gemmatimonadaceae bacterium]